MKRLICTLVVLALTAGCSSMRISMDYAEAADFTSFKTFQFKETEDAMVEGNQLSHQRIVDAITREMNGQGFTEVDHRRRGPGGKHLRVFAPNPVVVARVDVIRRRGAANLFVVAEFEQRELVEVFVLIHRVDAELERA